MNVSVMIRDGVARTTVDQRFFNPGSSPVEGYYWFTIPEGAAVDRFALEVNSVLLDGEVVERKQAHAAYEASIRTPAVDPALLEWIDGRTYRARIFPIPAAGDRRVVLSYVELLPTVDGRTHYIYPMGGSGLLIQEFSLDANLGDGGTKLNLATTADARIEDAGRRVTMRRSGYRPQGDFLLEMTAKTTEPLRALRVESLRGEAAYAMLRYTPDVKWEEVKQVPGHVVVVVDTSAGGDDADRQLRTDVAEATLRALSTSDRFALMVADLTPRVIYPEAGLAPADEASIGKALEKLSAIRPGGATDLGAVFDLALKRVHGTAQPAVVYVGDGLPTVGELDGDALAVRVTRSMAGSSSRLFTIAVGSDANHALLTRLARIGGGGAYRVDLSEQSVQEALRFVGQLKTPTITNLKIDAGAGMDQVFLSAAGKISRGQEVTLLARTHHPLPATISVTGELGGKPFQKSYQVSTKTGREYAYVPTLWARRYLQQLLGADLQKNRGTIIRLGIDYALMTPFSSFLVLDSEEAYQRFGIPRRPKDPIWGLVPRAGLDLEALAAAPLALFGCSKSEAPMASRVRSEEVARRVAAAPPTEVNESRLAKAEPAPEPSTAPPAHQAELRAKGAPRSLAREEKPADAPAKVADERDSKDKAGSADLDDGVRAGAKLACSDAARRSLAHRRALWIAQLDTAGGGGGWIAVYRRAGGQCELPHWRDRKELLDVIQARLTSPAEVSSFLAALGGDGKARDFVRRQILRRAVTPDLQSASSFGDSVDWTLADAALAKIADREKRLAELRKLCEQHPTSSGCALKLITALIAAGRGGEALPVALKLREDGRASPALMQQIGDLLVSAKRDQEAIRAYSEIVEFSPNDPAARQLLGDVYLRHGWYELAYRQFRTLAVARPDDPLSALRLAAAAAGVGRVDEALRIERKVAGGEGEPGPNDPRRWARLWSAARVARLMLAGGAKSEGLRQSMERALRRLQVIAQPGVLVIVTWEDRDARLGAGLGEGSRIVDRTEAPASGLVAMVSGPAQGASLSLEVKRAGGVDRRVGFQITAIVFDGRKLSVANQAGKLDAAAASSSVTLALPR
jgi:tetratricopeptide (TPR) repeat protein